MITSPAYTTRRQKNKTKTKNKNIVTRSLGQRESASVHSVSHVSYAREECRPVAQRTPQLGYGHACWFPCLSR